MSDRKVHQALKVEAGAAALTIKSETTGLLLRKTRGAWRFDSVLGWNGKGWSAAPCRSPFAFNDADVETDRAEGKRVVLRGSPASVAIRKGGAGLKVQFRIDQAEAPGAGGGKKKHWPRAASNPILTVGAQDGGAILGSLRFVTRGYRNEYVSGFPGAAAVMRDRVACALLLDPDYDDQWSVSKAHGNVDQCNFVTFPFFYNRSSIGILPGKGGNDFVPLYLVAEKLQHSGWRGLIYASAKIANENLPFQGPPPPTPQLLLQVIRQYRDDAYSQWIEPYGYASYLLPDGQREKKWPELKENWPLIAVYNAIVAASLAEVRALGLMRVSKEFLLKAARSVTHYQRPCADTGGIAMAIYDDGRVGDYIGDKFFEGINCINLYIHAAVVHILLKFLRYVRDEEVEVIVRRGLQFLKSVRYSDGSFPAVYNFVAKKVPQEKKLSVGITGLCALAFLDAYDYFGDREYVRMAGDALTFTRREWHSWGTQVDINWNWLDYVGGVWIAMANLKAYEIQKRKTYLREADYWLHYVSVGLIRYENDVTLPSANTLHEVAMEWQQPFKQHSSLSMPDIRGRISSCPETFLLLDALAWIYRYARRKEYKQLFERILASAVCMFRMARTNYVPRGTTTEQWNIVEDSELVGGAFTGGVFIWALLARQGKELAKTARHFRLAAGAGK